MLIHNGKNKPTGVAKQAPVNTTQAEGREKKTTINTKNKGKSKPTGVAKQAPVNTTQAEGREKKTTINTKKNKK